MKQHPLDVTTRYTSIATAILDRSDIDDELSSLLSPMIDSIA